MNKSEIKILLSISISIATMICCCYNLLLKIQWDISSTFKGMSYGLSIVTVFWAFYYSFGWKWPILNLIFYRPNLNGTWTGKLNSDWKDTSGNSMDPIEFHIVVRQNFLRIHFTTFTCNFIGMSYAETIRLDKDKGLKNVAYMYRKDTTGNDDKILLEGATELRLIKSDINKLQGIYWSNRKTNGTIDVSFMSKKHVDSFECANKLKK